MTEEEFIEALDIRQDSYGSWCINGDVSTIKGDVRVVHGNVGVVNGNTSLVVGDLGYAAENVDYNTPQLGWEMLMTKSTEFQINGADQWSGIPFHPWKGLSLMQGSPQLDSVDIGVSVSSTKEDFIADMDIRQDSSGDWFVTGEAGVVYGDIEVVDGDVGIIHGSLDLSRGPVIHVAGTILNYPGDGNILASPSIVSGSDSAL